MARAEMTFTVKDIPEVKALVAQLTDRAEKAEAAIERVRAIPAEHRSGGHYMVSMRDVLAAIDGTEATDAPRQ